MPNCDFYANSEDHIDLLTWLFSEGTCHVYESYSDFETPLKRFFSSSEVIAQFDRQYATGEKWKNVHLQLHVTGAGPSLVPRRLSLNPTVCDGATYRYSAEGWGLVQLYLGGPTNKGLEDSHTNHNTQKRAEAWAPSIPSQSDVGLWDFKRITSFSSRLNRQVRKLSVGKLGSRAVLPGALKLWQSGVSLLPFKATDLAIKLHVDA